MGVQVRNVAQTRRCSRGIHERVVVKANFRANGNDAVAEDERVFPRVFCHENGAIRPLCRFANGSREVFAHGHHRWREQGGA